MIMRKSPPESLGGDDRDDGSARRDRGDRPDVAGSKTEGLDDEDYPSVDDEGADDDDRRAKQEADDKLAKKKGAGGSVTMIKAGSAMAAKNKEAGSKAGLDGDSGANNKDKDKEEGPAADGGASPAPAPDPMGGQPIILPPGAYHVLGPGSRDRHRQASVGSAHVHDRGSPGTNNREEEEEKGGEEEGESMMVEGFVPEPTPQERERLMLEQRASALIQDEMTLEDAHIQIAVEEEEDENAVKRCARACIIL